MLSHRLTRALVGGATLALTAGTLTLASPATAAPVFHAGRQVIVGDLTSDGINDRLVLGSVDRGNGITCAYQLQTGLGAGRFAAPYVGNLPFQGRDPDGPQICPDVGVVVKGPTPAQNQLAVADSILGTGHPTVQFFRGFATHAVRYTGGFDGQFQTGSLNSTDFDGDGWGDIWESTDQGSGFTAWVGRPTTGYHVLYGTPFTDFAPAQFFDLNRAGGTDILVSWNDSGQGSGAAVVDGRTGAVQVLGPTADDPDPSTSSFDLAVVDLNHDRYPDIRLTTTYVAPQGGYATLTTDFLNRSQGGRWYFQQLPQPGA